MSDERSHLPVAPWATSLLASVAPRALEIHEVDARVVAALVRARLSLEKGRGWLLLTGLVTTVAGVVGLGITVHSKLVLGVLAPLVASVPFAVGLVVDRISWLAFERLAKQYGLSGQASRRVFDGALGADPWISVLTACGRAPDDAEITRFVIQSSASPHGSR